MRIIDDDLGELRALISEMGGRAEAAVADAVAALVHRNEDLAQHVIAEDKKIDALAMEVERKAITTIALRHPLAGDLRDVLAALKIAGCIARMGDCAKSIAHRSCLLRDCRKIDQLKIVPAMQAAVSAMVKASLDAFASRSAHSAARICADDDQVDTIYAELVRALVEHMKVHAEDVAAATHLLMIAQKLERIGDHASRIAEIIHHAATGSYTIRTAGGGEELTLA